MDLSSLKYVILGGTSVSVRRQSRQVTQNEIFRVGILRAFQAVSDIPIYDDLFLKLV